MRVGRTHTPHFRIETRQHDLLGLDLGEGVPRRALVAGGVALLLWVGLLVLLFGSPNKLTIQLYLLPPILLAVFGMRRSERFPSRVKLTEWALRLRYLRHGHRPIIRLGARPATKAETLPWRDRLPEGSWDRFWDAALPWHTAPRGFGWLDPRGRAENRDPAMSGAPVALDQRPQLVDQAHMYAAYEKTFKKRIRTRKGAP